VNRDARIVLIRHAQTEWSVSGQHTGRTDLPLLPEGRERAEQLRPVLAEHDFALVLTSPLQRAADTARLAGLDAAELEPDLVEWDYGEYEGRTKADIRAERPGWQLFRDGAPGGESPADVAARADRVIERAVRADGDVALVAHGHILRTIAVRWVEQPLELGPRLPFEAGHVSVLGLERELRVIRHWGSDLASAHSAE
jgi:probable phosphoglycerate mutase